MAYELVYTSAPQGVYRGSSGFCVVGCTRGLGPRLIAALEGYSAYKPLYPHYAENAWSNPVSRSHCLFDANGERQHILSRICFNGVDYTGRSNKLASHLVLSAAEAGRAAGGPASLLLLDELFKAAAWPIEAEFYDTQREIPATAAHPGKCTAWEKTTGDAGWGGYLAQCFIDHPERNVYVVYDPEQQDLVPRLFDEAINLLPEDKRWEVTFNTYFVTLPAGASCAWRGVPRDSDAVRLARRSPANIVIDLARPGRLPEAGELIEYARTGVPPKPPVRDAAPPSSVAPPVRRSAPPPTKKTAAVRPDTKKVPEKRASRFVVPATAPAVLQTAQAPVRKVPWGRIVLLALAVVGVVAALIAAAAAWKAADSRRTINQCVELRGVLDAIDERRAELESEIVNADSEETLKKLAAEVGGVSDTLESIEGKAAALDRRRELVEEALSSGKLTDAQTPGRMLEDCVQLRKTLEVTENKLKHRRDRLAELDRQRKALKPPEKKTAEKPKPEDGPPKAPPAAPPKKATAAVDKKIANPDKPDLLWLRAEALYKSKGAVKLAVGDVAAEDIEILFFPEEALGRIENYKGKVYHPGDELKCMNANGDYAVVKADFDAETGELTLTPGKYLLPEYQLILVRVKRADGKYGEYPLFFKIGVSRLGLGKLNYHAEVSGAKVVLKVTGTNVTVPKRIYGGGPSRNLKYKLVCSGKNLPLADGEGGWRCEAPDKMLAGLISSAEALAELKKNIAASPAEFIEGKVDRGLLTKEQKKQFADWENLKKIVRKNISEIAAALKLPKKISPENLYKELRTPEGKAKLKGFRSRAKQKDKHLLKIIDKWDKETAALADMMTDELKLELLKRGLPDGFPKDHAPDLQKTLKDLIQDYSDRRNRREEELKEQCRKAKFVVFYGSDGKTTIVDEAELESK